MFGASNAVKRDVAAFKTQREHDLTMEKLKFIAGDTFAPTERIYEEMRKVQSDIDLAKRTLAGQDGKSGKALSTVDHYIEKINKEEGRKGITNLSGTMKFLDAAGVKSSQIKTLHALEEPLPDLDEYHENRGRELLQQAMNLSNGTISLKRSLIKHYKYNAEYQKPDSLPSKDVYPDYYVAEHLTKLGYLKKIPGTTSLESIVYSWEITKQGRRYMIQPPKHVKQFMPSKLAHELLESINKNGGSLHRVFKLADLQEGGVFPLHYQPLVVHKLINGGDVQIVQYGYRMELKLTEDGKRYLDLMRQKEASKAIDDILNTLDKGQDGVINQASVGQFRKALKKMRLTTEQETRLEEQYLRNLSSVDFARFRDAEARMKQRLADKDSPFSLVRERIPSTEEIQKKLYQNEEELLRVRAEKRYHDDFDRTFFKNELMGRVQKELDEQERLARLLAKRTLPGRGGFGSTAKLRKAGRIPGTTTMRFKFKKAYKGQKLITRFRQG